MRPWLYPIIAFAIPFSSISILPFFYRKPKILQSLTAVALFLSAFFSLGGLLAASGISFVSHPMGGWFSPYGIEWRLDSLSALMSLLITSLSFIIVMANGRNVLSEIESARLPFYVAVLLNTAGLIGMIYTHDLFNLFVFLEVSSITTYALIATGDRKRGNLASFRYLMIGTVGASFYLLGVGYLYSVTGTLNMTDMAHRLESVLQSKSVLIGLLFIFIGFCIKMGLFPFHGWLPDAYAFSSNSAASLIAPLSTKVAIYAFLRIFHTLLQSGQLADFGLTKILLILGTLAIVTGSTLAFFQTRFRRMLAYSSISHIGLIMLAVGVNHKFALIGAVLHIVFHAVMKATLFLIAAGASLKHRMETIDDFEKMRGQMPHTMRAYGIAALSMIGIPPFCGFFSKWYIFSGCLAAQNYLAAGIVVFSGLLTALYFFKWLEKIFFSKQLNPAVQEAPAPLLFSYGFLSIMLIVLGILAPMLMNWGLQNLGLLTQVSVWK